MKKTLLLLIIFSLNLNLTFANQTQSTNQFPLTLEAIDIPQNSQKETNDNGLSGGAVTAITLGSIGVVALSLLGLFWYKKYQAQGLLLGCAIGCDSPILPICLDKNSTTLLCAKYKNYPLLRKALLNTEIHECPNSKYILIPDTEIKNKIFDTYFFEIPKNLHYLKIIQIFETQKPNLKVDLYKNSPIQEELKLKTITEKENLTIQHSQTFDSKQGAIVISNDNIENLSQKYAILIEIYK